MTTPKALGRSFKNYATQRADLLFHVTKYPQLDGTILRSFGMRNFTETAFTSKKYVVTQLLTMPILLPIFAGSYYLTGHFTAESAYRDFPSIETARLTKEKRRLEHAGKMENKTALAYLKARKQSEKVRVFGEKTDWERYRRMFHSMLDIAVKERLFNGIEEVDSFYGDLEHQSEPFYDEHGELMLKVNNYGKQTTLGLTRGNILEANSDARLSYKLMLVKIRFELQAAEKNREPFEIFAANWRLLKELSRRSAEAGPVRRADNPRFLTNPVKKSPSKRALQFFRQITH